MLTTQHIQEGLSRAYVQAVAAKAGVNLSLGTHGHDYGVDGTFHQVEAIPRVDAEGKPYMRRRNSGFNLEFQCKASRKWRAQDDVIAYDLEVKTYNDLINRSAYTNATPLILILMCLPADEQDWLLLSEQELLLRKCCYWHQLSGAETGNENTKTIHIPRSQILDPAAIVALLKRVELGSLQ